MNKLFAYFFLICLVFACHNKPEQMIFPENLEIIHQGNPPCPDCNEKAVFYVNMAKASTYLFTDNIVNWKDFAATYPDLSVSVYLGGEGKDGKNSPQQLRSFFEKQDFPYPVYLDPEDDFFETNQLDKIDVTYKTVLHFLVEGNRIVDLYNFGMPNDRVGQLEEHFGMKPVGSEE
ncbi:hypothetical protein [Algoriphagus formosus]|uniref:Uncharacterized protein n=1 Tax=Algoriphagus formosus TaxID=2007308 RepID=A0A4R5VCP1_9BACT|nr:hypothetical protein [Algoriphagus aquimaris]TDK50088.1 hypothetical protein E1898_01655 [Algoriphagus aquimaris]